jgi:hypothetical protein
MTMNENNAKKAIRSVSENTHAVLNFLESQ